MIGKLKAHLGLRFLQGAIQCKIMNLYGLIQKKTTEANADTYQTIKHNTVDSNYRDSKFRFQ